MIIFITAIVTYVVTGVNNESFFREIGVIRGSWPLPNLDPLSCPMCRYPLPEFTQEFFNIIRGLKVRLGNQFSRISYTPGTCPFCRSLFPK